ncbi:AMP binding protein [Guyanagaster necrorhizus]|uniref:AMP binding protein n=1 Tax=Guyanagaster necrorhizus TaxID=856835 RepID=A0A9P7VZ58_9AGAR|nr:AMP binding protein [Guyanagaster necrorhizus MCA 3950]KAG7449634.1 AMP binding protein [Guyanagaster necrorhizus MCA 3950]
MPAKIYTSPDPSVPIVSRSIFTHLLAIDGDLVGGHPASLPAFVDSASGTTITRAQLRSLALSLGYALRNHPKIGAKRGDVVLVYSQNSLAWPVVVFGSISAGLRTTFANSAYTSRELAHQYTDSRASYVFTTEEGLPTVREMFRTVGVGSAGDEKILLLSSSLAWAGGPDTPRAPHTAGLLRIDDLLSLGKLKEEDKFEGHLAQETVLLCYSSGTTGKPKGVETKHQNLTSVVDMSNLALNYIAGGPILGVLPFYHIYGAVKLLLFPLRCGSPCIIQPRFDPAQFCANIERYKVKLALIVPPIMVVFARHAAVEQYDLTSLKVLISGAAPLGAALTKQVNDRLHARNTNCAIVQGYGLTETSPMTHLLPPQDAERKMGSIGVLLPNLEARLVNEDVDAAEGQPGELWIRGPTVMKGYLNNVEATKEAITPDGWFMTGDVTIRDKEGFYFIVDRRKELIKYKGFQVPPAELESVLLSHPDIADVAVVGVYDAEEATELPRAYVVPAKPQNLSTDIERQTFARDVSSWIQTKVARHKFLRGGVTVIDVVPKSAAGKILRRELRDRAKAELERKTPKAKL